MHFQFDDEKIGLRGEVENYDAARKLAERIFAVAEIIWPTEAAAHDAEIEADAAPKKKAKRKSRDYAASPKAGGFDERVLRAFCKHKTDNVNVLAGALDAKAAIVSMSLARLRRGGHLNGALPA